MSKRIDIVKTQITLMGIGKFSLGFKRILIMDMKTYPIYVIFQILKQINNGCQAKFMNKSG
jgi:hypothetical protein